MPEISRDVTNDQQLECSFGFTDMDYEVYQSTTTGTSNANIEQAMNCSQAPGSYNYHTQYNIIPDNDCEDTVLLGYDNSQALSQVTNQDHKFSASNHNNLCLNSSMLLDHNSMSDIGHSRRGEVDFSEYIMNNSQSDTTKEPLIPIASHNDGENDALFMMNSNPQCTINKSEICNEESSVTQVSGASTRSSSSSSSSRSGEDYLSLDMDNDLLLPSANLFEFSGEISDKSLPVQPEMGLDMLVSPTAVMTKNVWTPQTRRNEVHDYDYSHFDEDIDASLLVSGMSPAFDLESNASNMPCGPKRTGPDRSSSAINNAYRVRKMTTKAKHLNKGDTVLLKQPSFALGHEEVGTFGFMNFRRPGAWTRLKPGEADDDRRKRAMTKV